MPIFRYKSITIDEAEVNRAVPGTVTVVKVSPNIFIDVSADGYSQDDLDEVMADRGYFFVEEDPVDTVNAAASETNVLPGLDGYEPEANLDQRTTDIQLSLDGYSAGSGSSAPLKMGYNGNAGVGRHLQYQHNIGSNQAPLVIHGSKTLEAITIKTDQNETASFEIKKNGSVIHTFTITAADKKVETGIAETLVQGDEISVRLSSGSFQDPILTMWFE